MFAVIKTGGKQYRVEKDNTIEVERLEGKVGDSIKFGEVLMAGDGKKAEIGTPRLNKVVEGKIVSHVKGPKIFVQKFRRRKDSKTKTGHRQLLTQVKITSIKNG